MITSDPLVISGAVEGLVDEVVLRRMVELVGARLGPVYGKNGKRDLRRRLRGYNQAACFSSWIVLVALDRDADCAPPLRATWLLGVAPLNDESGKRAGARHIRRAVPVSQIFDKDWRPTAEFRRFFDEILMAATLLLTPS